MSLPSPREAGHRVVGRVAVVVVLVVRIEDRQVQLVIDQVVDGVLESTGLELVLVVNHNHGGLLVFVMVEPGQ